MVCSFGQLASMVSEQSEMIQRIDANTYVPLALGETTWHAC
jgi:hypothetical protein